MSFNSFKMTDAKGEAYFHFFGKVMFSCLQNDQNGVLRLKNEF